jgi:hypothetical protein
VNRHVIEPMGLHERASATPVAPASKARAHRAVAPSSQPSAARGARAGQTDVALRDAQLWFARAVTTPESTPQAVGEPDAERVLTAGPRLCAAERLEIYRRAYHARLVECLADDYPVLQYALGEGAFEGLCRAYIARHPSESPSLNAYGRRMADFCQGDAPSPFAARAFAADLARLEWAIVEVIHAPSSEPLTLEGLQAVPLEQWAGARLVRNSAFVLLRSDYPVNAFFQSFREGRRPAIPVAEPSATVVYRSGPTVWRMDLTVPMFEVLSSLAAGENLATALSRAEPVLMGVSEAEAAQRVLAWFREWVTSGLFTRVELGPAPPETGSIVTQPGKT